MGGHYRLGFGALIAVWVSSQDSCNWAKRAFTKAAARRSMNSGSEVAECFQPCHSCLAVAPLRA